MSLEPAIDFGYLLLVAVEQLAHLLVALSQNKFASHLFVASHKSPIPTADAGGIINNEHITKNILKNPLM